MLIRLDKYLADMQVGTRSEVKELIRKRKFLSMAVLLQSLN